MKINVSEFNRQLLQRRREILSRRESGSDSWQQLQEPEVEFEENAAEGKQSRLYEQLDDREKQEIEQIDAALGRIETQVFGICDACGKPISEDRLKAVPWTPFCVNCVKNQPEAGAGTASEAERTSATASLGAQTDYSDTEIEEMITDELIRDGRIDDSELHIYSSQGTVYLEGLLPGKTEHELLISLIADTLGFKEIEDRIKIDRQLWEQPGRGQVKTEEAQSWKEKKMQGEAGETDVWASEEFGTPLDPPDKMIPEK